MIRDSIQQRILIVLVQVRLQESHWEAAGESPQAGAQIGFVPLDLGLQVLSIMRQSSVYPESVQGRQHLVRRYLNLIN